MLQSRRLTAAPTGEALRRWNIWLAIIQLLEAAAILLFGVSYLLPISLSFLTPDRLLSNADNNAVAPAAHQIGNVSLGWLIAAYFIVSALVQLSLATWCRRRYETALAAKVNRFRWAEYAVTASLMLFIIALASGMYDLVSLLLVAGLGAGMHLVFWQAEQSNRPRLLAAYWIGVLAGCLAWLAILLNAFATATFSESGLAGYVWGIIIVLIVLCACLAVNLWLQLERRGPWKNYAYGERLFMILSFVAKTVLAWQLFAGVLHP